MFKFSYILENYKQEPFFKIFVHPLKCFFGDSRTNMKSFRSVLENNLRKLAKCLISQVPQKKEVTASHPWRLYRPRNRSTLSNLPVGEPIAQILSDRERLVQSSAILLKPPTNRVSCQPGRYKISYHTLYWSPLTVLRTPNPGALSVHSSTQRETALIRKFNVLKRVKIRIHLLVPKMRKMNPALLAGIGYVVFNS